MNKTADNSLIEIKDQSGVEMAVELLINKNQSLLPNNVGTERIKASAGFYIANREDLLNLNKNGKMQMLYGILKEAMVGCEAGIDFDIIPFKQEAVIVRKKEGWFKIIDLIKPSEIIRFTVNVITKDDKYSFNPVTEELIHTPKGEQSQKYEDILGTYAYIKFANGFEKTVLMTKSDLDLIKNISPSGSSNYSPWNAMPVKMVKAKVTKELAKELFTLFSGRVNSILANAIESDEISIINVDEKGHILQNNKIYETGSKKEVIDQTEIIEKEEKEVNINEI